jgi:hypothetical protein
MKTCLITIIIGIGLLGIPTAQAGEKKLAQTGFQFLSISADARAAAMADAYTSVQGGAASIFFNPANISRTTSFLDLSLSQNSWIADIQHLSASLTLQPFDGTYGVLAASMMAVDYGEIQGTMVDPNSDKGYIDTDSYTPSSYALGIGYANSLTDRFSIGGHVRYAHQQIGSNLVPVGDPENNLTEEQDNTLGVVVYDFGTIYRTGFKSFVFGMSVCNFSKEIKYENESFQLPLTFRIGMSMDVFDLFYPSDSMHSLLVSVDALHPRAYSERLNVGAEYLFMDLIALRGGALINYDERSYTAGVGVQKQLGRTRFGFDYAYTPFGIFDNVQHLSFKVSF